MSSDPTDILSNVRQFPGPSDEGPVPGFEGATDEPSDFDIRNFVPDGWDLFEPDVQTILRQLSEDKDPVFASVRLWRVPANGTADTQRIAGDIRADVATSQWLLQTHGPGRYDVVVLNARKRKIQGRRISLGGTPGQPWQPPPGHPPWQPPPQAAPAWSAQPPWAQPPSSSPQDRLMQLAVERLLNPEPQRDSIRDAMAEMVKLMQVQMQASQQMLQNMIAAKKPDDNPLLNTLLEKLMTQPASQQTSAQELMSILMAGVTLRDNLGGGSGGSGEPSHDTWISIIPSLVDSIGPPMAATIAGSIKDPVKSKMALDAINAHMKAREAEANAEPIDVDGQAKP